MAKGQLTVIAGKSGLVWVEWTGYGEELRLLEQLRNDGVTGAQVYLAVECDRMNFLGLLIDLDREGHWVRGRLYSRVALSTILDFLEEAADDDDAS